MNLQTLCFNYLRENGFVPNIVADLGIVFKYQRRSFVIQEDEHDDRFFRLILHHIEDVDSLNCTNCLKSANEVNKMMKVVKINIFDDRVDACVEMIIDTTPVVADFLPRCLDMLLESQLLFYKFMKQ